MSIQFNKVTWYSKLLAIILFIGVIPTLTFYIGTQYEKTRIFLETDQAALRSIRSVSDAQYQYLRGSQPMNGMASSTMSGMMRGARPGRNMPLMRASATSTIVNVGGTTTTSGMKIYH